MTKKQAEAHLAKLARRRARYAERKKQKQVAPTPRAPEQMALPFENRIAQLRPMTPEAQREIDLESRNIGREWIRKILASMEGT